MTSVIDSHETNLDSRALAVDLVRQGYDAVMDCDTGRTLALVTQATQGMSPDQLKRLIHQMAWIGGTLGALLPDQQRQNALAGLLNTNGDQS
jgi:hypothetical protein